MCQRDLAVRVLQDVSLRPVEHTETPHRGVGKAGRVTSTRDPLAARFDADECDVFVFDERVEKADGIRTTTDTGHQHIRQASLGGQNLLARLVAYDALEIADNAWVGMRTQRRAEQVVGGAHVRYPVTDGFVDGILERAAARVHWSHLGTEKPHPKDVESLALNIRCAHIDDALQPQQRADRCRRDAMLTGPCFGHDAPFAHPTGQQRLSQCIVDLVGPRVGQVLALEVDPRPAECVAQTAGQCERCGTSCILTQESAQLLTEGWVGDCLVVGRF